MPSFWAMSVKWNLAHLLGRNILSGNLYARLRFQHRTTSHDCPQEWRTELCRNRTYLLSRTIFPFRTSTLFMFVDYRAFPLPLETINYLTGNLSGCNGLSGLAQFRTFIFIPFLALRAFFVGIIKTRSLSWAAIAAVLINIPFNYLLIFTLKFGIAGSAIASTLAEMGSLIILLIHMWRKIDKKQVWTATDI
mgnify:CR=1 FL=1